MRRIDADALKNSFRAEYNAYRARGANVTLYDLSYTLGDILEMIDRIPTAADTTGHEKCRDCKWLSKTEKRSIGYLCTAGKNWRSSTAMWKYPSTKACKGYFERREE